MKGDRASKGLSWDFLRQVKVRFGASKHVVCMIVVQMQSRGDIFQGKYVRNQDFRSAKTKFFRGWQDTCLLLRNMILITKWRKLWDVRFF